MRLATDEIRKKKKKWNMFRLGIEPYFALTTTTATTNRLALTVMTERCDSR